MTRILDCTLRDGGYNTGWSFTDDFVRRHITLMAMAGVSVVEVGYRRPPKPDQGAYERTNDESVRHLVENLPPVDLCVMIDASDYISGGNEARLDLLAQEFSDAGDACPFKYVRVAATQQNITAAAALSTWFRCHGYTVILSTMRMSTISAEDASTIYRLARCTADVVYWADSFGAIVPRQIPQFLGDGLHTHDNLGLALANVITAASFGYSWFDASAAGFGRGAGNLRLEQLGLYLAEKCGAKIDVDPLLEARREVLSLADVAGWGWSPEYMYSGLRNIHPSKPRGGMSITQMREELHA